MATKKSDGALAAPANTGMAAYTQAGAMPKEMTALTAPDRIERLTLAQGQMKAILDRKATPGDWLHGMEADNLGAKVEAWVAAWRPHALRVEDEEVVEESFDPESETFRSIVRGSMADREEGVRNAYGPEFLLWVPSARAWAVYTFGGTARRRGRDVFQRLGQGVALGSESRSSKRFTWLVPTVAPADVAAPPDQERELAVQVFLAPIASAQNNPLLDDAEEV